MTLNGPATRNPGNKLDDTVSTDKRKVIDCKRRTYGYQEFKTVRNLTGHRRQFCFEQPGVGVLNQTTQTSFRALARKDRLRAHYDYTDEAPGVDLSVTT